MVRATQRYLEALTVLDDAGMRQPSVLPGWTRAHVVGHLARNADALTQVLQQVLDGSEAYMYQSQADRETDIQRTASLDGDVLRQDSVTACARLEEAAEQVGMDRLEHPVSRTAGGDPTFTASDVGSMRRTEVEIHHADLGIGYTAHDWPTDFSLALVERRQDELASLPGGGPSMVLSSTDLNGLWRLGVGGLRSTGPRPTWPGGWSGAAEGRG
jgi:maleylpyruvate isomerase